MKSRIPVDERALYFHAAADDGEYAAISGALERVHIPVRRLDTGSLECTLGELAAPGFQPDKTGSGEQENGLRDALVFKGLSRPRLDAALQALTRAQAGQGALKAVLTEHNQRWQLRMLLGELEREKRFMGAYHRLHGEVQRAIPVFEQRPSEPLAAALRRAQAALQSQEPALQELQEAWEELYGLLGPQ